MKLSKRTQDLLDAHFAPHLTFAAKPGAAAPLDAEADPELLESLENDHIASGGAPGSVDWAGLLAVLGPLLTKYGPQLLAAILQLFGKKPAPAPPAVSGQ